MSGHCVGDGSLCHGPWEGCGGGRVWLTMYRGKECRAWEFSYGSQYKVSRDLWG